MTNSTPSPDVWQDLYQVAMHLRILAPWRWMYDSDIFGVKNPATAETGYCCILGALGEVLGLVVYLGTEGLDTYSKVVSRKIDPLEIFFHTRALMVTFDDRRDLKARDLQKVKEAGLKIRGRQAWPCFRSLRPGYEPWYLTPEEAVYLTLVMRQAIEVAHHCRGHPDLLDAKRENYFLVRTPVIASDTLTWKDTWEKPQPAPAPVMVAPPPDPALLQRVKNTASKRRDIWEVDWFYFPKSVQGPDRPYFPLILMVVHQATGIIIAEHVADPAAFHREFQEKLLQAMENLRLLPGTLLVKKDDLAHLLQPLAAPLRLKVKKVKKLKVLQRTLDTIAQEFFHALETEEGKGSP
jgi:hypothetical protein